MHFGTGVLCTSAWAGVYITQVRFLYQRTHLRTPSLQVVHICVYAYTCVYACISEDCFYYCSERNDVEVLFGTLKVQSFVLTEVRDCDLLIVVTSSTFLKRKDMSKEKSS